jgi:hypothetical protein
MMIVSRRLESVCRFLRLFVCLFVLLIMAEKNLDGF